MILNREKTSFDFIQNLYGNITKTVAKEYILKVDGQNPKKLRNLQGYLRFLHGKIKTDECEKLVRNLYDNRNYDIHTKTLKYELNYKLILEI